MPAMNNHSESGNATFRPIKAATTHLGIPGLAQGAPSREVPPGENYVAAFTEGVFPSKYSPLDGCGFDAVAGHGTGEFTTADLQPFGGIEAKGVTESTAQDAGILGGVKGMVATEISVLDSGVEAAAEGIFPFKEALLYTHIFLARFVWMGLGKPHVSTFHV
jgi:hypothetical protein